MRRFGEGRRAGADVQEAYSRGARLQVGGTVSDHHHRLEAVLLLQGADDLSFAAALGGGLALVKTGELAWRITEEMENAPETPR